MILRVHLRTEDAQAQQRSIDYSPRPLPFGFSALIHAGVLALVAFGPPPQLVDPEESKSLYQIAIAPNRKKIIWYRLQDTLPPISPANQQAEGAARGRIQSFQQPIVAKPPNAPPGKQLIWQPAPKLRLEEELKSPNLVALQGPPVPAPPPPPVQNKPKVFVPPPAKNETIRQNPTLSTPSIDVGAPQLNAAAPGLSLAPKPKARAFQAPVRQEAKVSVPKLIDAAPEAGVSIGSASLGTASPSAVEQEVMSALRVKPKARAFQAPSNGSGAGKPAGNGNGALIDAGTGDQLSAAIIGLNPTDRLAGPLPDGVLTAEFSRAPIPGEPVMGGGSGNGVKIPDVMAGGGGKTAPAPPVLAPGASKPVYLETVLPPPSSTLAVPLRPSARTIPANIEVRFGQRAVYTMVVPVNLPLYSGDWILWFAEREPHPGTPQIRSPLPAKKLESLAGPLPAVNGQEESRIQLAATIRKDGTVGDVKVIRGRDVGLYQRAIEDLQNWQFHPASHNAAPVDVDIVVEIPFRLPPRVARQ